MKMFIFLLFVPLLALAEITDSANYTIVASPIDGKTATTISSSVNYTAAISVNETTVSQNNISSNYTAKVGFLTNKNTSPEAQSSASNASQWESQLPYKKEGTGSTILSCGKVASNLERDITFWNKLVYFLVLLVPVMGLLFRRVYIVQTFIGVFLFLTLGSLSNLQAANVIVPVQGLLSNNTTGYTTGSVSAKITIWDALADGAGTKVWGPESADPQNCTLVAVDGLFTVRLGDPVNDTQCTGTINNTTVIFGEQAYYLQIEIAGEVLSPRISINGALAAEDLTANGFSTVAADLLSDVLTETTTAANLGFDSTGLTYTNGATNLQDALAEINGAIVASNAGVAGVTSLAAGDGLTSNATSGDITLNVVAGTGISVGANSVAIDTAIVPRLGVANTFSGNVTAPVFISNVGGEQHLCKLLQQQK